VRTGAVGEEDCGVLSVWWVHVCSRHALLVCHCGAVDTATLFCTCRKLFLHSTLVAISSFTLTTTLEQSLAALRDKGPTMWLTALGFINIGLFINYQFMPLPHRVTFGNFVQLLWTAYQSWELSRKPLVVQCSDAESFGVDGLQVITAIRATCFFSNCIIEGMYTCPSGTSLIGAGLRSFCCAILATIALVDLDSDLPLCWQKF